MDRPRTMTVDQSSDESDICTSECSSQVLPVAKDLAEEKNSPKSPVSFAVPPHQESEVGRSTLRPTRESVLKRLSDALMRRSLTKIDLSQRSLRPSDARLVKMALFQNFNLRILKLCYNNLGDEGVAILAPGIAVHKCLESLDLGFNNIADVGCNALAEAILSSCHPSQQSPQDSSSVRTLYLAGNLIGEVGAQALANVVRSGSSLERLHLTGNRLGTDGVTALTEATIEGETHREINEGTCADSNEEKQLAFGGLVHPSPGQSSRAGLEELFLGGTNMGSMGCMSVARMLKRSTTIHVISVPNCSIGDRELKMLASSIKGNREKLPLTSLQLSFNNITCKGLDLLMNAIWGSTTLRELLLDNNNIGDRGAQQVAAILPHVKTLEVLDVGFNSIKSSGIETLMKVVAKMQCLVSLSLSGNHIDMSAAKVVAFALAYNCSLETIALVRCYIEHGGQRHIAAGVVSNSGTSIRKLTGFELGPILVTIGLPDALQDWSNNQVLNFIHLMWDQADVDNYRSVEGKELDPLHFLHDSSKNDEAKGPLEAAVVVEVAKEAFSHLRENPQMVLPTDQKNDTLESPLTEDAFMVEETAVNELSADEFGHSTGPSLETGPSIEQLFGDTTLSGAPKSFVVSLPEPAKSSTPDPQRKRRILDWLSRNLERLNELEGRPFDSSELWRLHQHYFTPVVNETGGDKVEASAPSSSAMSLMTSSVPEVSRVTGGKPDFRSSTPSSQASDGMFVPASDPFLAGSAPAGSLPLLKRKVSYRALGEAALTSRRQPDARSPDFAVSKLIDDGKPANSMRPMTKRARRNKARITFLPRVKAQLESYLDIDHEKALVLMRKLFFVEHAILGGKINSCDEGNERPRHLVGHLAGDAETILIDLI